MKIIDEITELHENVNTAFSAALFSMDYHILQLILKASKEIKNNINMQNYAGIQFVVNKCFWDIGMCIKDKIQRYQSIDNEFFIKIANNISKHLNQNDNMSFTSDNLERCYKLVELSDYSWFEAVASKFTWGIFAEGLEQSNSFNELKYYIESNNA